MYKINQNRKTIILLFFLLVCCNPLFSQLLNFKGSLFGKENLKPVAFAHVVFKDIGFGTSTNEKGVFKIAVDIKNVNSQVYISCLGYEDVIVNAKELLNKKFYLTPKIEVLPEISLKKTAYKEIALGSLNGKKKSAVGRSVTLYAQYIRNKKECCSYLKNLTIKLPDKPYSNYKARVRVFDKDNKTGFPKNDLLPNNVILTIKENQKTYTVDFFKFDVEVPEDGFFIAIEILNIPQNMLFISSKETSTYKNYVEEFKKSRSINGVYHKWYDLEMLDFETYKTSVTHYGPFISLTKRKSNHKDLGKLYVRKYDKWEIASLVFTEISADWIMPIEITLSN
jgi:hypothetical protein